jgi:hypothetical protein
MRFEFEIVELVEVIPSGIGAIECTITMISPFAVGVCDLIYCA